MKEKEVPCKNCICLPVCKGQNNFLILYRKCSLLRKFYSHEDGKETNIDKFHDLLNIQDLGI